MEWYVDSVARPNLPNARTHHCELNFFVGFDMHNVHIPKAVFHPRAHASSMPLNEKRRPVAGDISGETNLSCLATLQIEPAVATNILLLAHTGYLLVGLKCVPGCNGSQHRQQKTGGEVEQMLWNLEYKKHCPKKRSSRINISTSLQGCQSGWDNDIGGRDMLATHGEVLWKHNMERMRADREVYIRNRDWSKLKQGRRQTPGSLHRVS